MVIYCATVAAFAVLDSHPNYFPNLKQQVVSAMRPEIRARLGLSAESAPKPERPAPTTACLAKCGDSFASFATFPARNQFLTVSKSSFFWPFKVNIAGTVRPRIASNEGATVDLLRGQKIEFDGCKEMLSQIGAVIPHRPTIYGVIARASLPFVVAPVHPAHRAASP